MRSVLLITVIAMLFIPIAAGEQQYRITAETVHRYDNPLVGPTHIISFWLLDTNQWWSGGARFIYTNPDSSQVQAIIRHLTELFHDLGFITVAGRATPVYAKIIYVFDGVIEYDGFIFADGNGTITVEWQLGKPLIITINSLITANASATKYVGGAQWSTIRLSQYTSLTRQPELYVSLESGRQYNFLLVPREGATGHVVVSNYWGNETRVHQLGGCPKLWRETPASNIAGYHLRDSGSLCNRQPVIIVEDGTTYLYDWFWNTRVRLG